MSKCPNCESAACRFTGASWPQGDEFLCENCDTAFLYGGSEDGVVHIYDNG